MTKPMNISRREFLKTTMAAPLAGSAILGAYSAIAKGSNLIRDNILLIVTDQQNINTIAATGCLHAKTPNMDRLVKNGIYFTESYCTYPVCGPARSSIFTGRMPSETGVTENGYRITGGMANLGQWLRHYGGYETVYCGKWHIPFSWQRSIEGFDVIPAGLSQGTLGDAVVSRGCQSYLLSRDPNTPFFMVASFMQPHDICEWIRMNRVQMQPVPRVITNEQMPPLPGNFDAIGDEPKHLENLRQHQVVSLDGYTSIDWTPAQWRFYLWNYYRMVEEVDAEIGRVLDALENAGCSDNTAIILTSDHGESMGAHKMTVKGNFYEEAVKVPMVVCYPGKVTEDRKDGVSLVSGVDIFATACDIAGVNVPKGDRGISLLSIAAGKKAGHEYVVSELGRENKGWMLRTADFKYVVYEGDAVEQLFHIAKDPLEKVNLYKDANYAEVLKNHRGLLARFRAGLVAAPPQSERYKSWGDEINWKPA